MYNCIITNVYLVHVYNYFQTNRVRRKYLASTSRPLDIIVQIPNVKVDLFLLSQKTNNVNLLI